MIAAVNGFALGGGCEISMSCDIRICSENAVFGQPEVGLGIIPGFGGTQRLARLVSPGMAKQLIYGGRNIKAKEALRIGLVNAVYEQEELMGQAMKMAKGIAKQAPIAIRQAKKAINEGLELGMDDAVALEEKLFGEGGFPVAPIYYYTNMYCNKTIKNIGYTPMGYYFFQYAQSAE